MRTHLGGATLAPRRSRFDGYDGYAVFVVWIVIYAVIALLIVGLYARDRVD